MEHDATSILRQVKESGAPALITQEGRPEAVLLSIEIYEQTQTEREILARLAQGEQEIAHGRGYDLDDVLNKVAAARPRLKDLLLAESPRVEIPVSPRRGWRRRALRRLGEPSCTSSTRTSSVHSSGYSST